MTPANVKHLVRCLINNRLALSPSDWTVQGFGFLRLRVAPDVRIHIWDSRLREPGVSDIHDHTQWAFTSEIISGSLVNLRFTIDEASNPAALPHRMATLKCGVGGGMQSQSESKAVRLVASEPELHLPGASYRQEPDEIHRTMAADGTVTLIHQERREVDTARVFWPEGGAWGDAIPRQATKDEIDEVGAFALSIFNG